MGSKILLIDDSPTIRTLIKLYLMGRPIDFIEASGAQQGLDLARSQPVDLVIADFSMPGMNGLEFLQQFRATGNGVPVLLLTATKETDLRERALAAGANAFLNKPVSRDQLAEAVDRTLGKPASA